MTPLEPQSIADRAMALKAKHDTLIIEMMELRKDIGYHGLASDNLYWGMRYAYELASHLNRACMELRTSELVNQR